MKKIFLFLPLVIVLVLVMFLVLQLKNPDAISPSEDWRDKPLPEFTLPDLLDHQNIVTQQNLPQEPFILNVWASWCSWCIKEFPMLLELKDKGVKVVGLTYSDKPDNARYALVKWGNPFSVVIDDSQQDFLVQTLKVNSAPTSYLVDKHGIIRYQQKGYNPHFIQDFLPRLDALRKEP
ncbi:dihydroneopterin aldolase [Vespertiliibacter pulmonis]|uniref:Cytochrome c biogenesis protein CcmG/thiol:disulfide interchange protein DsbE n=1 Tax=Vespertiliibacter pulmonis TaxID=1443036 RepID=A0A3N4VGV5_9PAST|nr:redoxin family protein [Vespertiliibacter pulmonis]QLB20961.1 dihydroneopterin aldolase [Vespertiliibacter pulmonis]RPE80735.1 cytochrome c biogenesis protein CcmG/thiol:disulfide interchange protein DsbE [Vespertiliibacter pulmonis]